MPEHYLLIGADVVPTDSNLEHFKSGDAGALVGDALLPVLNAADGRLFNLEVPLTDQKAPIIKNGPHLHAPTAAIAGYKAIGANIVTLANNHILDQGAQGLQATVETLDRAGIAHVGTGGSVAEASKPFIFEFAGKSIGIYACAEHEFSIAGEASPGANPFDPLFSLDHVVELKSKTDYVIVLYHGGKEHYPYPSPNLQRVCRRLVDKGADLVVCQHSHCIGCEEKYCGGTIVYGQGNFIFDGSKRECWQTSLLIKLKDDFTVAYIPLVKAGHAVRLADENKGNEIIAAFEARSEEIKAPGFIEKSYVRFAEGFLPTYLKRYAGKRPLLFRMTNRLTKGRLLQSYTEKAYGVPEMLGIVNYTDCEAHRELLLKGLEQSIRKAKK